jgi:hypothetical protein
MRKRNVLAAVTVAFAAMLFGVSAQAQTVTCDDLVFTGPLLSQFANANDYCLDVVQKDGRNFAHFEAEYVSHSGSDVKLKVKDRVGGYSDTVSVQAPEGQRVKINGRELRIRELQRGDTLDIYVPPDRFVAVFHDTPEEFADDVDVEEWVIVPAAAAATLPATASPMPLIGLLGVLFAALGFGGLAVSRSRNG